MAYFVSSGTSTQSISTAVWCTSLLFCVGQSAGSLQVVNESLLRMRWQRDRLSAASLTSVTANAGTSVRTLPTPSRQPEDGVSSVVHIADELIRYVSDGEGLSVTSLPGDCKTTVSSDDTPASSDPRIVARALQHQQLRAEVTNNTN